MARTKQTARKDVGGKPLAMGRGKNPAPKPKPKPGRSDRKVIIEYSSDEEEPQQGKGAEAPKKAVKQIHLTLPTSPSHVTTTESFKTFFINHGLTRALRKTFQKRGWTTDQLQELMTNFKKKYGHTISLPKIQQDTDEDSSESEGLELQDGTKVGRKTPGGKGNKGGKGSGKSSGLKPGTSQEGGGGGAVGVMAAEEQLVVVVVEVLVADDQASVVEMMTATVMMTLTRGKGQVRPDLW